MQWLCSQTLLQQSVQELHTCTFPQHGVCVVVVWSATTVVVSVVAADWCDKLVVADGCDKLVVLLFVLQWQWIFTSSTSHSMNTSTYHNSCLWPHLLKFTSPAHTHTFVQLQYCNFKDSVVLETSIMLCIHNIAQKMYNNSPSMC